MYNGWSTCVDAYTDAACTKKKYLRWDSDYVVKSSDGSELEICNKARNLKMHIYLLFIPIAAMLQFGYA